MKKKESMFEVVNREQLRHINGGGNKLSAVFCANVSCGFGNSCPTGGDVECFCGGNMCIPI